MFLNSDINYEKRYDRAVTQEVKETITNTGSKKFLIVRKKSQLFKFDVYSFYLKNWVTCYSSELSKLNCNKSLSPYKKVRS